MELVRDRIFSDKCFLYSWSTFCLDGRIIRDLQIRDLQIRNLQIRNRKFGTTKSTNSEPQIRNLQIRNRKFGTYKFGTIKSTNSELQFLNIKNIVIAKYK